MAACAQLWTKSLLRSQETLAWAGLNAAAIIQNHSCEISADNLVPIDTAINYTWQKGLAAVRHWTADQATTTVVVLDLIAKRHQRAKVYQNLQSFQ